MIKPTPGLMDFVRKRCPSKLLDESGQHDQTCPACQDLLQTLCSFMLEPFSAKASGLPSFSRLCVLADAMNGDGALGRSRDDEPVFVLVARDKAASMIVRDWANMCLHIGGSREKAAGALVIADEMERWRLANGGGKLPD